MLYFRVIRNHVQMVRQICKFEFSNNHATICWQLPRSPQILGSVAKSRSNSLPRLSFGWFCISVFPDDLTHSTRAQILSETCTAKVSPRNRAQMVFKSIVTSISHVSLAQKNHALDLRPTHTIVSHVNFRQVIYSWYKLESSGSARSCICRYPPTHCTPQEKNRRPPLKN
jgi:hypothetical protein